MYCIRALYKPIVHQYNYQNRTQNNLQPRDVEAVKYFLLPLPASLEVSCFRVRFRFLTLGVFCFRFQIKLVASEFASSLFCQNASASFRILPLSASASSVFIAISGLKKIFAPLTKSGNLALKIVIKKGKILKSNLKRQSTDITHLLQCALKFYSDHTLRGAGLGGTSTHFI